MRLFVAASLALAAGTLHAQAPLHDVHQDFVHPPDDAKPMVRWWWFGPAVTPDEIRREIDQMHAGGFGGFELASVYPLALDDPATGIHNLPYASPAMVDMLRLAQQHGRELGMRVDLALGSGWPFGGPHIPLELAAGKLKLVAVPFNANLAPGQVDPADRLVARFVAAGTPEHWSQAHLLEEYRNGVVSGRNQLGAGTPHDVTLLFFASHTRQQVKRAAVGGEGYVLDHLSRAAIDTHLRAVGEPLLRGFAGAPPTAIFSDSLEVYGSDWTAALPAEFQRRRGYDLLPHLAELWQGGTPQADAIRHDWAVTLSELVRENYLQPLADFATQHGTKFRSQTYGEPAATFDDEAIPQLPEGEGPQWNAFSYTRWASSANHVYGNTITSAETWTWLHSPAFRATPLDMKVEADRMFLQGVNQIVGHGWPYSPPTAQPPGYSLYAAAVFNAHNPWWPVMPAVTRYLQRVSWLLRQGQPANDVAILLPEDDAQAAFRPGHVSVTDYLRTHITPTLMQAVLASGHNVDYVSGPALAAKGTNAKLLIVPPTLRISVASLQAVQSFVESGGKIIFVGTVPALGPGLLTANQSGQIKTILDGLSSKSTHVRDEAALRATITGLLPPRFDTGATSGVVGFIERRLPDRDVFFVANTSPLPQTFALRVGSTHHNLTWWNIDDDFTVQAERGEAVTLPPYGSRVLTADDVADTATFEPEAHGAVRSTQTLTHWTATFPGSPGSPAIASRQNATTDWSTAPATKFYSGEVRFTAHFQSTAKRHEGIELRFADGRALPDTQSAGKPGIRAWFDAPIREAATVFVNGRQAGVLWHPPYTLDISNDARPGDNTLEIRVYNTAINELADQPPRDYTALQAKYGERFQMQDMQNLQPVPSGIFGTVQIVTRAANYPGR